MLQTVDALDVANTTGSPDAPPVAVKVRGTAPNITVAGGANPVIVCCKSGACAKLKVDVRLTQTMQNIAKN
jgi:hypothetical protein